MKIKFKPGSTLTVLHGEFNNEIEVAELSSELSKDARAMFIADHNLGADVREILWQWMSTTHPFDIKNVNEFVNKMHDRYGKYRCEAYFIRTDIPTESPVKVKKGKKK